MKKNLNLLIAVAMILFCCNQTNAQTSTKSAGSAYQIIGAQWTNLSNISLNDGLSINCTLDSVGTCTSATACYISRHLCSEGFNFTIPQNAVIDGIKLQIRRKSTVANAIKDNSICDWGPHWLMVGMLPASSNFWGTTYAYVDYGGPNELWGAAWYPIMINDPDFGFSIECVNTSNVIAQAKIDHIRCIVYYHVGPVNKTQSSDVLFGNDVSKQIEIFPSPVTNELTIKINDAKTHFDFQILNEEGQLINEIKGNSKVSSAMKINVSSLPTGIYILRATSDKEEIVKRFIKE